MRPKLRVFLPVFFGAVLLVALSLHVVLRVYVRSQHFKQLAENKLSDFLSSNVTVGRIRINILNRVTFSDLKVRNTENFGISVGQIQFRYSLYQLIRQDFNFPASVLLKSPELTLSRGFSPFFFMPGEESSHLPNPTAVSLELQGGELKIPLSPERELIFSGLKGTSSPLDHGRKCRADFHADVREAAEGKIHLWGEMDMVSKEYRFDAELAEISLADGFFIPLKKISGHVRWENGRFTFEHLTAYLFGWKVAVSGSAEQHGGEWDVDFTVDTGNEDYFVRAGLNSKLSEGKITGEVDWNHGLSLSFEGGIQREKSKFQLNGLRLNNGYEGSGFFDAATGDLEFQFKREQRELRFMLNIHHLKAQAVFEFDHADFYGLDLVTRLSVSGEPVYFADSNQLQKIHGRFQSDYFILEYIPFDDFKGSVDANMGGFGNFHSTWGESFSMDGTITFRDNTPESRMTLKVRDFDLAGAQNLASKPLPKNLGGILEGKLTFEGPFTKPEITGNFNVKGGSLGRLNYDRGIFRFKGFVPYLPLEDSKILKGRLTMPLTGVLDLSLENMFHGVRLQTPDKIIIWKGWELDTSQSEGDVEIQKKWAYLPTLSVKGGFEFRPELPSEEGESEDEAYVKFGPKINF